MASAADEATRLARDVLFCRQVDMQGSLLFDRASGRLEGIGRAAIPSIEDVLRADVQGREDSLPTLGLSVLMKVYLQLLARHETERAIEVFDQMPIRLRTTVFEAFRSLIFHHDLPGRWLQYLQLAASASNNEDAHKAREMIEYIDTVRQLDTIAKSAASPDTCR